MAREDTTSQDLYDLLVTQNLDPEITDERGQAAQPDSGRVFTFDWTSETGTNYGTAVVLITDDGELQLFFGDNLGRGMEEPDKTEWYDFMQQLSRFAARNNFLTFSPKNLNRLKHAMAGMAAIREGLFEGYYGTKKVSYMGEQRQARLMIRHKHDLAETDRRHLNVESLFIETVEGERFKLPFRDLRGGKAMLTHVREGGRPYDVRGVHIAEMVEELKVLSRFNRASAGRVTEGVTQELVEQARVYYRNLRESMRRMGGHRGYQAYFETWTPLTETESESLVEDIKTLFTEQTLDTRIEAALPVLARIKETNMREADIFESYIDRLAEGTWAVPDTPEAERKLQELMAQELPVGPDATNATEQLFDLVGDDELYDQLEQLARDDPDADARPLIQARLEEMGFDIGQNDMGTDSEQMPDQDSTQDLDGMNEADNLSTFEGAGCNHTMEGESCPVHGSKACDMSESDDREDYNQTADELNRAREAGDMERIKQLSGQLSKQAGGRGFEIDIRGNATPLKESDELARLKNIVSSKTH